MVKILFVLGLFLLIPGAWTLSQALSLGPVSWALDQSLFWGTPIVHFVFWIGLAHAGTFLSAILLIFGVQFQKRISLVAELSTISSLGVAVLFPLIHLGIVSRFYFLVPFFNQRGMYVNFSSPLVWDFIAIGVYACLSLMFFLIHLFSFNHSSLLKARKVFAWLLFPLVLWVHTIVSLDFAVTSNTLWQGAYFPIYFILGALFSGLALVLFLLEMINRRVRKIEELLLVGSWLILAFWIWEFFQKGVWHSEVFILGFVFVQLFLVPRFRNQKIIRILVSISVLVSMWIERFVLIVQSDLKWQAVDFGWFALSIGFFLSIFFGVYLLFQKYKPQLLSDFSETEVDNYSKSFLLKVFSVAFLLVVLFFFLNYQYDPSVSLIYWIPVFFPLFALFAGSIIFVVSIYSLVPKKYFFMVSGVIVVALGLLAGAFYAGGDTDFGNTNSISSEKILNKDRSASYLWASRCASCHGSQGDGNRKFIYEYYPEPQKLSLERLDQQGNDSLVNVILKGRAYMNPFEKRLSESEAKALIRYMYKLAEEK